MENYVLIYWLYESIKNFNNVILVILVVSYAIYISGLLIAHGESSEYDDYLKNYWNKTKLYVKITLPILIISTLIATVYPSKNIFYADMGTKFIDNNKEVIIDGVKYAGDRLDKITDALINYLENDTKDKQE